jgi:hypothetical protein
MRFAYIDLKKIGAVFVIFVEFYEVADPATKRRSSVTAENKDKRLFAEAITQMKCGFSVERKQLGIASGVTDEQVASMPVWESIAEEGVYVFGAAGDVA